MARIDIVREPIGLRVLLHALRPGDREPFLLWRADPQPEADALIEAGAPDEQALLWASLLRWREAQAVVPQLMAAGWVVTLRGVRAIVLPHAVALLSPPTEAEGWPLAVDDLLLRAVPELPDQDETKLARLLAFLDAL